MNKRELEEKVQGMKEALDIVKSNQCELEDANSKLLKLSDDSLYVSKLQTKRIEHLETRVTFLQCAVGGLLAGATIATILNHVRK